MKKEQDEVLAKMALNLAAREAHPHIRQNNFEEIIKDDEEDFNEF